MYHNLVIYSPDGHLGCFWSGTTMSKAAINVHNKSLSRQIFSILLGKTPKSRIPEPPNKGIFIRNCETARSHCGLVVTNPTRIHEDAGSIPGLAQGVQHLALPWTLG